MGSAVLLTDTARNEVLSISYNPFGEVTLTGDVEYNPRRPGQYQDNDFVYYNGYRYYEPATGRYLQPEPIFQNPQIVQAYAVAGYPLNAYAYAANNPLRVVDPSGLIITFPYGASSRLTAAINRLLKSPYGRWLWNDLDRSSTNYRIFEDRIGFVEGGKAVSGQCGGPGYERQGPYGREVDIRLDFLTRDMLNRLNSSKAQSDMNLLAHELGHGLDYLDGFPPPPTPTDEAFADFVADLINDSLGWK